MVHRLRFPESARRLEAWWGRSSSTSAECRALVVTGFIAATADGAPTTLARSGSDASATIFAALTRKYNALTRK